MTQEIMVQIDEDHAVSLDDMTRPRIVQRLAWVEQQVREGHPDAPNAEEHAAEVAYWARHLPHAPVAV